MNSGGGSFFPQLIRIEIVIVQLHVLLKPIEAIVLDLLSALVLGDEQHRQRADGVEEQRPAAAARKVGISAGRHVVLGPLQRYPLVEIGTLHDTEKAHCSLALLSSTDSSAVLLQDRAYASVVDGVAA